jgi:trimethylamine--corrinoid protein Co-methyltransferase
VRALRLQFQLLRRSADEVRGRKLRHHGEACIRAGMPILLLSAGQAGRHGARAARHRDRAGGGRMPGRRRLCQRHGAGHPAVFGTWPFVSDLRSGRNVGRLGRAGAADGGLRADAPVLRLPGGAAAGIATAKLPDMQAGWEQAISNDGGSQRGSTWSTKPSACMPRSWASAWNRWCSATTCWARYSACVRGIDVTEDSVSLEAMREVCLEGPGHYLGHSQTLSVMQTEYVYPRSPTAPARRNGLKSASRIWYKRQSSGRIGFFRSPRGLCSILRQMRRSGRPSKSMCEV